MFDTGVSAANPHSTAITPSTQKELTIEEFELHSKANVILQLFLDLLHFIGGDLQTGKSASFLMIHRLSGGNIILLRSHHTHLDISLLHLYT
jgi:hypothetical protein